MQTPQNIDPRTVDYGAVPDEKGHFGPYGGRFVSCLLYTSPSPRDVEESRMPSSA